MGHHVHPAEFIDDSLESYLGRHRGNGSVIYLAVALTVIAGVAALPVVRVEVSSQAAGRVRSAVEPHEIRAPVSAPVAEVVADVYVESRDIAYVRPGMRVRMQVDAFDYNRWGVIEGRVLDVPDDVVLLDQTGLPARATSRGVETGVETAVYRVRCSLGPARLRSPDGRVGVLRKGMAVQARFSLGSRSLFELLWRDVRSWLDPASPTARAPRFRPPRTE